MKPVFHLLCALALTQGTLFHAQGGEPSGTWKKPPADGKSWKHGGTKLTFPQQLGPYRMMGEFGYDGGGILLRFENLDMRARADIFLFPANGPTAQLDDRRRLILKEMDTVVADLEGMANQGRYKNLQIGEIAGGNIPLFQEEPLPMATRMVTSTRIGNTKEGVQEAPIRQWVGVTMINGYLLTMRHMRPTDTGEPGEDDMKGFINAMFLIIKDPPMRTEVKKLVDIYLQNPLSADSEQAAGATLAYLKQSPIFPIHIPEHPVSDWMERCKTEAPGTEDHLLRAFMLGSAKAAFDDADAETCLNAGARQFASIYRILVQQYPKIAFAEIEKFVAAAEKDKGAQWLKEFGGG